MYIVFYSTSDVFKAEELLKKKEVDCKVVPTPVQDKAYCGVCIWIDKRNTEIKLEDMEYSVIE